MSRCGHHDRDAVRAAPRLRLGPFETGGTFPLANGQAADIELLDTENIIGRNQQATMRVSKSLVWISNKHFAVTCDASGASHIRDLSSNGTWLNGQRVTKETPQALKPGDRIELAAEEQPGQHRQVSFFFDAPRTLIHTPDDAKRQRVATADGSCEQHGIAVPTASPSAAISEAEALRAHTVLLEDQLKAEREASAKAASRASAELHALAAELHAVEQVAHQKCGELAAVIAMHEQERERLVACASEANQQLQRCVQEKIAANSEREAADRRLEQHAAFVDAAKRLQEEAEATATAEREKYEAAAEQARLAQTATAELRLRIHEMGAELCTLAGAS